MKLQVVRGAKLPTLIREQDVGGLHPAAPTNHIRHLHNIQMALRSAAPNACPLGATAAMVFHNSSRTGKTREKQYLPSVHWTCNQGAKTLFFKAQNHSRHRYRPPERMPCHHPSLDQSPYRQTRPRHPSAPRTSARSWIGIICYRDPDRIRDAKPPSSENHT
jgi:hypothetical protein